MRRQLLILATVALFTLPCCQSNSSRNLAKPSSASSSASASATTAAAEQAAYARLLLLQQQADAAKERMNHRSLSELADAMDSLHLVTPAYEQQRRELAQATHKLAGEIRDSLHRFLFAQLEPLPATQRSGYLQEADEGDDAALSDAAQGLAKYEYRGYHRYLRNTQQLSVNSAAPAGLKVHRYGQVEQPWQNRFNEAFNAQMLRLVAAETAPASKP